MPSKITSLELSLHTSLSDLWVAIDGLVYDLTEFAPSHPGGPAILLRHAGRDATAAYNQVHSASLIKTFPLSKQLGPLVDVSSPQTSPSPPSLTKPHPNSTTSVTVTTTNKPPLSTLISTHDFLLAAHASFPPKTLAFVTSAATDTITHRANTSAYAAITLRPRVLRGVAGPISLATTFPGANGPVRVRSPLFCAPTSLGRTVHPDGEREIARGCRLAGVAQVVSTSASFTLAEVFAAAREEQQHQDHNDDTSRPPHPIFFQLYVDKDRKKSERLLREAAALGIAGVFVTVDAPVTGKREADERVATENDDNLVSPMSGVRAVNDAAGGGLGRIMGGYVDASLSWADIAWLRGCLPPGVPVILKGVQTAADAVRAVEAGVEGIIVSNHGGRSLDTAPPTVLVLLELHRACPEVFGRLEVFVDGGVMRGTDVFKALCLGARGVGIGRGVLYGLGYGAEGVARYFQILNDELETTMRMCGITSLDEVHPGLLNTRAVDHLIPATVDEGHPYAKWRPKPSKL